MPARAPLPRCTRGPCPGCTPAFVQGARATLETCAGPSVLVPAGCPEMPGCTGLHAPFVSKVHAQGWKPVQGRVLYLQGARKRLDPPPSSERGLTICTGPFFVSLQAVRV